jgi:hypothetical protein
MSAAVPPEAAVPMALRPSADHRISDFSASGVEAPGLRRIHHTKARPPTIQRPTALKANSTMPSLPRYVRRGEGYIPLENPQFGARDGGSPTCNDLFCDDLFCDDLPLHRARRPPKAAWSPSTNSSAPLPMTGATADIAKGPSKGQTPNGHRSEPSSRRRARRSHVIFNFI